MEITSNINDSLTAFVNACMENTIPNSTVRCFLSNKLWISDLKEPVIKKKRDLIIQHSGAYDNFAFNKTLSKCENEKEN